MNLHRSILLVAALCVSTTAFAETYATVTYPPDGTTNADLSQPIQWTTVADAQAYYLYVGTTLGAKDLVNTGEIQRTYQNAPNLPAGQTIYVRIYTKTNGSWHSNDSTFTAAPLAATITYPENNAVNADLQQPIQWTTVANAQAYYLYVGTTPGAKDLVNTGEIQRTYQTAPNLPAGQTLYARLHTKVGGVWRSVDSSFSAAPLFATITFPTNGASNVDMAQPIQWTTVPNAQAYYLYVGTTPGAKDLVNTGEIQRTYQNAPNLPGGQTVYARIYTKAGDVWRYSDTSFSPAPLAATITSPVNGAVNVDLAQPIQWTTVANAQAYYLYVGTTLGAKDLVNTGEIQRTYQNAPNLPGGQIAYARIYTKVANVWRYTDSTFTPLTLTSTITYPANGTQNADPTQAIQWTSVENAQAYYLYVGTAAGTHDLVSTGEIQATSYLATGLPPNQTLYARIFVKMGGAWRYSDSTFSVAQVAALLTYPTDGQTGVTVQHPFTWNAIENAQGYFLYVGTTPGGLDVTSSGEIQTTSFPLPYLLGERTLYARLFTKMNGIWFRAPDVTFTSGTLASHFIFPARGSVGVQLDQPFQWTAVPDASGYRLVVSTTRDGHDLIDTGVINTTSVQISSLPTDQILYARVYTVVGGVSRFSDTVFTLMPEVASAALTYPAEPMNGVNTGQPFEWDAVDIAAGYRLELGTAAGLHDLHDSGSIRVTRRLVPGLPAGVTIYGRLSTSIAGAWIARDFTLTVAASAISAETRMANALWATHQIWSQAPGQLPSIAGEFADVLSEKQKSLPVCSDYALELVAFLAQMNIGTPVRILNVALNPNTFDAHTLVEVKNEDNGRWMLVDPTFDLTVKRADGEWATAGELSDSTRDSRWTDISYEFLGPLGDYWTRHYYIDYPLLFVNIYQQGAPAINGEGSSILQYFDDAGLSVTGPTQLYAIGCGTDGTAPLSIDGSTVVVNCDGVDGLSRLMYAATITPTVNTSSVVRVYRPKRFVF